MWRARPPPACSCHHQPLVSSTGHQLIAFSAALACQAFDWGLVHGAPEKSRAFGSLRTEVACLLAAAALSLCAGLVTLLLQNLSHARDRLELNCLTVAGRLGSEDAKVLRGGLAVAGKTSGRWLAHYQYVMFGFILATAALTHLAARCGDNGPPYIGILCLTAAWILPTDPGRSELVLGPLICLGLKWAMGLRSPEDPRGVCMGFMERSSLMLAALHGLHLNVGALLVPGLPHCAQLSSAAYLVMGGVEHWLRYWDAVAVHKALVASESAGLLGSLLLGNGDAVSLWEGAILSLLVYLATGTLAAGLFFYARHRAEEGCGDKIIRNEDKTF